MTRRLLSVLALIAGLCVGSSGAFAQANFYQGRGGNGIPQPVVNGECIVGSGGVAIWGSCSGSGAAVTSVTGTAGQVVASPTTGDVILTLASTISPALTFSGANAYGTPASITLTHGTGLPISTGVSGLGTNVGNFLATPSSANLALALTDETGTGAAVFGTSPSLTTPTLVGATLTGTLALGTQTVSGGFTMSGVPSFPLTSRARAGWSISRSKMSFSACTFGFWA